jgi:hypothetical protein
MDGGVSGGFAWLVMIERASVLFASRTDAARWDLRVTELFRRNGDSWESSTDPPNRLSTDTVSTRFLRCSGKALLCS